jgi:hypothetical protein
LKAVDVNVLLYALRKESERHAEFRAWLLETVSGDEPVGFFEPVLAALFRIATHPGIYKTPTPRSVVEAFLDGLMAGPAALPLRAGERHFEIFRELCRRADCRGTLVQDAYLAALALEQGCTWFTTDRDFARFPRLVWSHPLDGRSPVRNPA